jgi:hypothetical protein
MFFQLYRLCINDLLINIRKTGVKDMLTNSNNRKTNNDLSLGTFIIVTLVVLIAAGIGCYLASGNINILNETSFL